MLDRVNCSNHKSIWTANTAAEANYPDGAALNHFNNIPQFTLSVLFMMK